MQFVNRTSLAACLGNACAYAVPNTSPLVLGALMTSFSINEAQAGALVTVELLAMGVASLLIAPGLRGPRKRPTALLGTGIIAVSEAAAALSSSGDWIFVWMAGVGLGAGLLLAALNAIIASTQTPDKLFGYALMTAYGVTALLVFAMTPAIAKAGSAGAFAVLAVFTVITLPCLRMFPREGGEATAATSASQFFWRRGSVLMFGIAVIGLAMMGFYAYIERLGVRIGLSLDTIGTVFALQQVASVVGSALAARYGVRVGLVRSLVTGTSLHTVAVLVAVFGNTVTSFSLGVISEGFTFLFLLPVLFTVAAELDPNGRWAAAANGALFISTGAAPFVLGALIGVFNYPVIGWTMLAATPVGLWAFVSSSRRSEITDP